MNSQMEIFGIMNSIDVFDKTFALTYIVMYAFLSYLIESYFCTILDCPVTTDLHDFYS